MIKLVDRTIKAMGDGQYIRVLMFCSFLAAACTTAIHGRQDNHVLRPPIGNSLAMKIKTEEGRVMYKCSAGEWLMVGATAGLVQATDPSSRVGLYTSAVVKDQTSVSATWILNNSPDDIAESGHSNSSVTGKEIETMLSGGSISEALLQATVHQFSGAAAMISYVQRLSPRGGDRPPAKQTCYRESSTLLQVPFDAEFWLWKQDLVPPSAPLAISVSISHERAVQGLFGEGEVKYRFDGSSWQQVDAQASLYNVPGGTHMGKYSLQAAAAGGRGEKVAASYSWKSVNPNGFEVVGRDESEPVLVDRDCLAWFLVAVTRSSNNDHSMLGASSHVQMVSTKGGLPPSQTTSAALEGELMTAPFSAIFWFYTKS